MASCLFIATRYQLLKGENKMNYTVTMMIVRKALTFIAGILATAGYLHGSNEEQVVSAVILLISVGLSIYNKFNTDKTVKTALELPQNSSLETLKDVLKTK